MADSKHSIPASGATRRTFLSASAALGAVAAIPATALAMPSAAQWDATMRRYLDAKAATDRYLEQVWRPAYNRRSPGTHSLADRIENEAERLSDAEHAAHDMLIGMPAPNRAAVRWKLDYLLGTDHDGYNSAWSESYIRQTIADYRRLLGDA